MPEPYGFAALRQAVFADDYRGGTIAFRAELRATEVADQAACSCGSAMARCEPGAMTRTITLPASPAALTGAGRR